MIYRIKDNKISKEVLESINRGEVVLLIHETNDGLDISFYNMSDDEVDDFIEEFKKDYKENVGYIKIEDVNLN